MAGECNKLFDRNNLSSVADVEQVGVSFCYLPWKLTPCCEQNCATGLTAEGKVPKGVVEDLVILLENKNLRCVFITRVTHGSFRCSSLNAHVFLSSTDKARLIALYIIYRDGVSDEDRRRLYQHARLSSMDQDAVNALIHLGARVVRVRVNSPVNYGSQHP